ncbi:MAG: hypothetical protein U9P42_01590 [Candidatus Fermentibacteria bacterium]|nr:hypothetical protein [Candidatus Fermentibacteria bacterium]
MLIAVLQMDDLEALNSAKRHLEENGYHAEVGPFAELPVSDRQDWMTPENGGYIFYLEKEKYQAAMKMLGTFFGYTG